MMVKTVWVLYSLYMVAGEPKWQDAHIYTLESDCMSVAKALRKQKLAKTHTVFTDCIPSQPASRAG